jgi:hypothetical protein
MPDPTGMRDRSVNVIVIEREGTVTSPEIGIY